MYPVILLVLIFLCMLYVRSAAKWRARSLGRPLPPGPPSLPVVGNLFNTPRDKAWYAFRDLAAHYGNIIHFRTLGQSVIILGSREIINEYLEKRASNTSDRPQTPIIELTFLAIILKVVYDIGLTEDHSTYAATFEVTAEGILQGLAPGKYIIDVFPFLKNVPKWVPGFSFQADFERWHAAVNDAKNVPFAHAREAMAYGEGFDSIVTQTLAAGRNNDECEDDHEEMVKGIGLVSYEAGADTSFSALQAFFLAMSLNPEVQKKAQAEIDAAVGPDRLPDFSDSGSLVYVNAVIKETLRWHTVVPLGVSHATVADDELHGYFIPSGTVILPNIWACMHDPAVYEDPDTFRPERFIRDGKLDPSVLDPVPFVFGFGRRICPGWHFALSSLFIHIASVLYGFDITPPLDADGRPIAVCHITRKTVGAPLSLVQLRLQH